MAIIGATPYLYYEDADAALTWLEEVLGFTDPIRWRAMSQEGSARLTSTPAPP
jgi:uncharacterized glyoxalase superfamily protein PhnB